jgi:hypothetical protein
LEVRLLACTLRVGKKPHPGGAAAKDKDVSVQTIGQQKSRCIGAQLSYDVCVKSRVVSYVGEHDVAAPYKMISSDHESRGLIWLHLVNAGRNVFDIP